MNTYEIVPTTVEHAIELGETMSDDCLEEVWASAHYDAWDALIASIRYTDNTYTGLVNGEVLCIYGVGKASLLSPTGHPWLLSSVSARDHMRGLARGSRIAFKHMTETCGVKRLENYVDARYTVAVRWLEWMGFTLHPPEPFGAEQLPFHRFTWDLDDV